MAKKAKARVKVPKAVKSGTPFLVKTLVFHKMETGLRKDKKTGKKKYYGFPLPVILIDDGVKFFMSSKLDHGKNQNKGAEILAWEFYLRSCLHNSNRFSTLHRYEAHVYQRCHTT